MLWPPAWQAESACSAFFGVVRLPLGLTPYLEFKRRVLSHRDTHGAQTTKSVEEWLDIVKSDYASGNRRTIRGAANTVGNFLGSNKYMVTRGRGVIDLEHYFNAASTMLSSEKTRAVDLARMWEMCESRAGGASVEDSPSNYAGALLGHRLRKLQGKSVTLNQVANAVAKHLLSFAPLRTQRQEDLFLEYVSRGQGRLRKMLGLGDWLHRGWFPPPGAPRAVRQLEFFRYNRGGTHYSIFVGVLLRELKLAPLR